MPDTNLEKSDLLEKIYIKLSNEAQDLEKGRIELRRLMSDLIDKKKMAKIINHINNIKN